MNRRQLFGMLGVGASAVVVGIDSAIPGTDRSVVRVPGWEDMTAEERQRFGAACKAAWDAAREAREYKFVEAGFEWIDNGDGTMSPRWYEREA